MRVESPFFDKSSSRFILERSRGLGILTFGKIKKTEIWCRTSNLRQKQSYLLSLCRKIILLKSIYKIFCYGECLEAIWWIHS